MEIVPIKGGLRIMEIRQNVLNVKLTYSENDHPALKQFVDAKIMEIKAFGELCASKGVDDHE